MRFWRPRYRNFLPSTTGCIDASNIVRWACPQYIDSSPFCSPVCRTCRSSISDSQHEEVAGMCSEALAYAIDEFPATRTDIDARSGPTVDCNRPLKTNTANVKLRLFATRLQKNIVLKTDPRRPIDHLPIRRNSWRGICQSSLSGKVWPNRPVLPKAHSR